MTLRLEQDLIRVPAGTLAAVQRVLASDLDAADAARHLRRIGMESGGEVYERLLERVADGGVGPSALEEVGSDEFWHRLDVFFRELGWGGMQHERLHPGVFSVSSTDWFESAASEASEPVCHFTVGLLGELFRRVAGTEVAVLEVRCRGAASDECRFLVGSPDALEAVFEQLSEGTHYREAVAGLGD